MLRPSPKWCADPRVRPGLDVVVVQKSRPDDVEERGCRPWSHASASDEVIDGRDRARASDVNGRLWPFTRSHLMTCLAFEFVHKHAEQRHSRAGAARHDELTDPFHEFLAPHVTVPADKDVRLGLRIASSGSRALNHRQAHSSHCFDASVGDFRVTTVCPRSSGHENA